MFQDRRMVERCEGDERHEKDHRLQLHTALSKWLGSPLPWVHQRQSGTDIGCEKSRIPGREEGMKARRVPLPSVTGQQSSQAGRRWVVKAGPSWGPARYVGTLDVVALKEGKRPSGLESPLRPLTNRVLTRDPGLPASQLVSPQGWDGEES